MSMKMPAEPNAGLVRHFFLKKRKKTLRSTKGNWNA